MTLDSRPTSPPPLHSASQHCDRLIDYPRYRHPEEGKDAVHCLQEGTLFVLVCKSLMRRLRGDYEGSEYRRTTNKRTF